MRRVPAPCDLCLLTNRVPRQEPWRVGNRPCPPHHVHNLHHLVDAAPCAASGHAPHTCGRGGARSALPEDAAGRTCVPTATRILAHSQWVGATGSLCHGGSFASAWTKRGARGNGSSSPLHARSGRVRCRTRRAASVSRETRGMRMRAWRRDGPRAPAVSRGERPVCGASPRETRERDGICQPGKGPHPTLRVPYGPISVVPEALRSSVRSRVVRSGRQISA